MTPIVAVPARMAATRLPGKPLLEIAGEAMIVHVWRRAVEADIGPVIVACAEAGIAETIEAAGGRAVLTDPELPSGSDRVHQAVERFDPEGRYDAVVNLQGDLPTIDPESIRAVLKPLSDSGVDIATIAARITDPGERQDPNVVKIAAALRDDRRIARALYFSRCAVPWDNGDPEMPLFHHIGLYAFRRPALTRFVKLPYGDLERRERLEQLRALEAGMRIDAALVDTVPLGVDTPSDLARAQERLDRHRV